MPASGGGSTGGGDSSYTKLFYLSNLPDAAEKAYVGMNYRTVNIVPIPFTKLAYFALCAEGFEATKSVNQLVCIILEAVQVKFHPFLSKNQRKYHSFVHVRFAAVIPRGSVRFRT